MSEQRPATIGELIEQLQQHPAETPLHYRGKMGDFPPGYGTVSFETLAVSKVDPGYTLSVNDPTWKRAKIDTHEPFRALVFWGGLLDGR